MDKFLQDLRYGARMLAKSPGFTVVAVMTIALGIGANTAVFSVMNAVILKYLPVPHPEQLVYLHTTGQPSGSSQTGEDSLSFPEHTFEDLRTQQSVFSGLMAYVPLAIGKTAVRSGELPEEARAEMVSGNFFTGLGVQPSRGRLLTMEDETQHAEVAVLSYGYWTRRFARNPEVIGQTLFIKGIPFTITGVAAQDFAGVQAASPTDIWIPLQNRPDLTAWGQSSSNGQSLYGSTNWWCLMMVGRLARGTSRQQAIAQLTPVFQNSAYAGIGNRDVKEQPPQVYFTDARGIGAAMDDFQQPIRVLMVMVGFVLVIACGNVAMLLVARNAARQREFSLRMALGAGRPQIFRQLLTESLLLVSAGAAIGWLFTIVATRALAAWSQLDVNMAPDRSVLFFTIIVSGLAAVVLGLAPLHGIVRIPPGLALKATSATATQDRHKLRSGQFVVAFQIALCLALLAGGGLLVRTLRNLETTDLGLRASGLLVFGITPPQTLTKTEEVLGFYKGLTDSFRVLPGAESVTLMQNRIGSGWSNNTNAIVDGAYPKGDSSSPMRWNAIGPDYFHVMGTSILRGRDFTEADSFSASKVAIINQTFADRYLPNRDPIGHSISSSLRPGSPQLTIVGVAADSKYTGVREARRPVAYFSYTQVPGISTMHFELRTQGDPTALLPAVRAVVRNFGPDLPLLQPATQQEEFEKSFTQERLFARLSLFFGLLAVLLVATGLYGTLAYRVGRRTSEIGVRMALGAQRKQVLWMVLRESLFVGLSGVIVGLPLAFAGAKYLSSMLYGVTPGDPLTFAAALACVVLVALIASLIPARRAASVDPMVALRCE